MLLLLMCLPVFKGLPWTILEVFTVLCSTLMTVSRHPSTDSKRVLAAGEVETNG